MKKRKLFLLLFIIFANIFILSSCKNYNKLYSELEEKITDEIKEKNVTIKVSFKRTRVSDVYFSKTASGVIIKKDINTYYVLTNNHLLYSSYNYYDILITDYYGNYYNAFLYNESNDSSYDLALLSFETENDLSPIEFSNDNTSIGDVIASIGYKNDNSNILTLGKYLGYTKYEIPNNVSSDECNISFDVIKHTAYINEGSSGSMLIDSNLKLIGINFSSALDNNNNYINSYAIPMNKINEYLEKNNFIV